MLAPTECCPVPSRIGTYKVDHAEPQILIVDPHPVVRLGIRDLGKRAWGRGQYHECECGRDAVRLLAAIGTMWSVIIVDAMLPDLWFLDLIRSAHSDHPTTPIVVFAAVEDDSLEASSAEAGVKVFLRKSATRREIISALRRAVDGGTWFSPTFERVSKMVPPRGRRSQGMIGLSPRERAVLAALGTGIAQKEIARNLRISPSSVATHVSRISHKLGVRTTKELLCQVWKWRFADCDKQALL